MHKLNSLSKPLGIVTFALLGLALVMALFVSPTERSQGNIQRIFYLHLPVIWVAYLAFFVVFVCSILYLWQRWDRYDRVARSSAEIGLLFTSLVLITGSIWARPIWGTWWTWDARLTTTLMLWFIFAAYVTLRGVMADQPQSARYAAVLGIVGFLDIPIIHQSVVWWRTLHPLSVVLAEGGPAMPPIMVQTVAVSLAAFTALYAWLLIQRVRLESIRAEREQTRLDLLTGHE